jgi:hypothetical protein
MSSNLSSILTANAPFYLHMQHIAPTGGTGNTLLQLRKLCDEGNSIQGTCVEPSDAMRQVNDGIDGIKFVDNDVLSWVNSNSDDGHTYTHILFKEMVHHIPIEELHEIFAKLKDKLDKDGIVLIVTRNQLYQDFPLPAAARYVWNVSCLVLSCLVVPYHIMLCYVMFCHIIS